MDVSIWGVPARVFARYGFWRIRFNHFNWRLADLWIFDSIGLVTESEGTIRFCLRYSMRSLGFDRRGLQQDAA